MSVPADKLQADIAAIEAKRAALGDAVADLVIATLRAQAAALAPAPAPIAEQTLRTVTIVFLDVVGSTRLSQHLDPEAVHAVMDGLLACCTRVVEAHGGRVLQYAGDSVLAVFGADEAREDDPERAVRAGLALLEEGRIQGEQVLREHGHHGFDVRVGAHTGGVLLGGGVDDKGAIHGFSVSIAARMEQTAPPGRMRISHDTYHAVRGAFDVQPQPPLQVKGRDEPILTYLVERVRARSFRSRARGVEGVESRMIGRERELEQLVAKFDTVSSERCLRAVSVVADAGLGKSRLLHEFQKALDVHPQPFWLLLGRADPQTRLQPYGLLRDVLAWRLQIGDGDTGDVARNKLVSGLAPWFEEQGEMNAHLIGQLIGMDFAGSPHLRGVLADARQLRDRAFNAATLFLRRLAAREASPVVMLLEDLHWADDGSLDYVGQLVANAPDLPLLLVMSTRPELLERRPGWAEGAEHHERADLRPLPQAQQEALADALLARLPDAPQALRELITGNADGNPFYMEELVQMLIDDGVIVAAHPEHWHVLTDKLVVAHVPPTLSGVLQARLDALAAQDRLALQNASIVGHVFWDGALEAIDSRSVDSLDALQRKSLAERRDTVTFEGVREYRFQHHLLHQVTYETVLRAQRRGGHAKAARWLAERLGDRAGEYLALTAEHYDRAGDQAQALHYFERAAREAQTRYASTAAMTYLMRALAMPMLTDLRRRAGLLDLQCSVADILGDRAAQAAALDERDRVAELLDDDVMRARNQISRALLADRVGDYATAATLAREALSLAERVEDAQAATLALGELAWLDQVHGRFDEARRNAQRALDWARRHPTDLYQQQMLTVLAAIETKSRDFERARAYLTEARAIAQNARNRRTEGSILSGLGQLALAEGDAALACHWYELATSAGREIGSPYLEGGALWGLGTALAMMSELASALAPLREATRLYALVGNRLEVARCRLAQGGVLAAIGDWPAAKEAYGRSLETFAALSSDADRLETLGLFSRDQLANGETAAARANVEEALALRARGVQPDDLLADMRVALGCHLVLAATGETTRALETLATANATLMAAADRISDVPARARLLHDIPEHRMIVEAWARLQR